MENQLNLDNKNVKIGIKETIRAINSGKAECVIIARDADEFVTRKVRELVNVKNIKLIEISKKSTLGDICKIDVAAAVAVIIK